MTDSLLDLVSTGPLPWARLDQSTRLGVENRAVSVDERTDGLYARLEDGSVETWRRIGPNLFELVKESKWPK